VRQGDTTKIPGGLDHAQVSAPGYGMYYLWIVRHLPRRPYKGFTFTPAHTWLLDPARQGWQPAPSLLK
jgi:5-deoxy-glucuronate isomerase